MAGHWPAAASADGAAGPAFTQRRGAASDQVVRRSQASPVAGSRRARARRAGPRLASRVVRAARDLPVAIVCDDDEVAAWAAAVGAAVLWRPGVGLNGAVAAGVDALRPTTTTRSSWPTPTSRTPRPHCRCAGSPASPSCPTATATAPTSSACPTDCGFRFAYGPGSFARHRAEVARVGPRAAGADRRCARLGRRHARRPRRVSTAIGRVSHDRPCS